VTDEEEQGLRKALGDGEWSKVAIAIHTGLRRGEQFGLRWKDVDFTTGIVTIARSKSGEMRRVPMNDDVRELLRSLPSRLKSKWVLPSQAGGTPLDAKNFIRRVFEPALEAAKIKDFHWHDLRHPFASRLVVRGVDLRTVQELMGHQSYELTLRYSHLSPCHQLEAVQRLNAPRSGTTTDTEPEKARAAVGSHAPETTEAPDLSGASGRAGDRGRTGDVQLGKRRKG